MRSPYNRSRHQGNQGVLKSHCKKQAPCKNLLRNQALVITVAKKTDGQQNTYFNKNRDYVGEPLVSPYARNDQAGDEGAGKKKKHPQRHYSCGLPIFHGDPLGE